MSRILVVEDDVQLQGLITRTLAQNGFEVLVAGDGIQATELALQEKPDLIILDMVLPGCDGTVVLKNVRSRTGYIPIVVLTGAQDDKYRRAAEAEGVDVFLEKPFELQMLMTLVRGALEDRAETGNVLGESPPDSRW